jgi:hypothetical protein
MDKYFFFWAEPSNSFRLGNLGSLRSPKEGEAPTEPLVVKMAAIAKMRLHGRLAIRKKECRDLPRLPKSSTFFGPRHIIFDSPKSF